MLVVDPPDSIRRQAVPLGLKAAEAIVVLVAMVVLLVTGIVPSAIAGLLAASAMVLLGVVTPEGAYKSISWTTVVLVAGMIPLSTAMTQTGAADLVAETLVSVVGPLRAGRAARRAVPHHGDARSAHQQHGHGAHRHPHRRRGGPGAGDLAQPVLMSVTVAAAASFLTPVATPVNMMVMGPGGYRFGDYWKLGLAYMAMFFVAAVFLVPVFWPF